MMRVAIIAEGEDGEMWNNLDGAEDWGICADVAEAKEYFEQEHEYEYEEEEEEEAAPAEAPAEEAEAPAEEGEAAPEAAAPEEGA